MLEVKYFERGDVVYYVVAGSIRKVRVARNQEGFYVGVVYRQKERCILGASLYHTEKEARRALKKSIKQEISDIVGIIKRRKMVIKAEQSELNRIEETLEKIKKRYESISV